MSTSVEVVEGEFYEDFISDDEVAEFETDIEEIKYQKWVDRYPEHAMTIFGALIAFSGDEMTEADVLYFKNKGVNLNVASNVYRSDAGGTTPLGCASEFRLNALMHSLIKHGALIDQEDQHGFTPIESVLMGHGYNDQFRIDEVEICVKLLVENNVKNELQEHIILEYCEEYWKSDYLSNFLHQSQVRPSTDV